LGVGHLLGEVGDEERGALDTHQIGDLQPGVGQLRGELLGDVRVGRVTTAGK